jgi:hypothetical protein
VINSYSGCPHPTFFAILCVVLPRQTNWVLIGNGCDCLKLPKWLDRAAKPQVLLYGFDSGEVAALYPILQELNHRGIAANITRDLEASSEVGLYACTPNRLYDFANHILTPPKKQSLILSTS